MKVKIGERVFDTEDEQFHPLKHGWDQTIHEMTEECKKRDKQWLANRQEARKKNYMRNIDDPRYPFDFRILCGGDEAAAITCVLYTSSRNHRFVLKDNFKEFGPDYRLLAYLIPSPIASELDFWQYLS